MAFCTNCGKLLLGPFCGECGTGAPPGRELADASGSSPVPQSPRRPAKDSKDLLDQLQHIPAEEPEQESFGGQEPIYKKEEG